MLSREENSSAEQHIAYQRSIVLVEHRRYVLVLFSDIANHPCCSLSVYLSNRYVLSPLQYQGISACILCLAKMYHTSLASLFTHFISLLLRVKSTKARESKNIK